MKNIAKLMKQAQEMKSKMGEMQHKLETLEVTGESGAGVVKVTMNGKSEILRVDIDQSLIDPNEKEVLEDLIVAASRDAKAKVEAKTSEEMSDLTGGFQLPEGFKLPF